MEKVSFAERTAYAIAAINMRTFAEFHGVQVAFAQGISSALPPVDTAFIRGSARRSMFLCPEFAPSSLYGVGQGGLTASAGGDGVNHTSMGNLLREGPLGFPLGLLTVAELDSFMTGGESKDVDLDLLKKITEVRGLPAEVVEPGTVLPPPTERGVVKMLFEVLQELTPAQRTLFLNFVWGTSILPTNAEKKGLKMSIHVLTSAEAVNRLPSAHTCFMIFELPNYPTKEILREKLMTALYCNEINF